MPAVVACGGRSRAFKDFQTAHKNGALGTLALLLVDSEVPVTASNAWEHVRMRPGDEWERPGGASDNQLHLMVQAMEAWFYADKEQLLDYHEQGFGPTL